MRHAAIGLLALAVIGCGGGDGTVSGTVTFDDKPVETGSIKFVSADGTLHPGGAVITDGRFQTQLAPGKYKIEVTSQKKAGHRKQKGFDGKDELIELTEEMIPAWYNVKTELSEEIKAGTSSLKFDLKSKK